MQNEDAQIGIFLIQGGCTARSPANVHKAAIVEDGASQRFAKPSTHHIVKEMAQMKKTLAVLMAGLFTTVAFAQAPAVASAPVAASAVTTLAAPAPAAARTSAAKAPVKQTAHKKATHKKVAHKKAVHKKAHRHA